MPRTERHPEAVKLDTRDLAMIECAVWQTLYMLHDDGYLFPMNPKAKNETVKKVVAALKKVGQ